MEDEKLYTVDEVAALFRVSRYTILRRIKSGALGAEQIGGVGTQYRIPQGAITEFRKKASTRRK